MWSTVVASSRLWEKPDCPSGRRCCRTRYVGRVLLVGGTSWWYRWILTADPLRFFKRSCEGFHLPRQTVDGGSTPGVVISSVVADRPPLKYLPWCRDRRRFGRPLPPIQQSRPGFGCSPSSNCWLEGVEGFMVRAQRNQNNLAAMSKYKLLNNIIVACRNDQAAR